MKTFRNIISALVIALGISVVSTQVSANEGFNIGKWFEIFTAYNGPVNAPEGYYFDGEQEQH